MLKSPSTTRTPIATSISPPLTINQMCSEMVEAGKKVFRFGFGESPFPIPKHIVDALQKNAYQKSCLPTAGSV